MRFLDSKTHTIIGLVVGVVLVAAPWLLGFADESEPAKWFSVGVGLFIIVNELITTSPVSPIKLVPMSVHLVLDVVTGLFLALTPLLFGFADEDPIAWVPHLVVGLLIIGYALMTKPVDAVTHDPKVSRAR